MRYSNKGTPWRAWSRGKGKYFSRQFATHAEAVQWATFIAQTYLVDDEDTRLAASRRLSEERKASA